MDERQNEEFTNYLRAAVAEAERLKYHPTRFKGMLESFGGFETVKRILSTGRPSDGFVELWRLNRLNLTCEAIVVETKWRDFFDNELIQRAESQLRGVGYNFKRFTKGNDQSRAPNSDAMPASSKTEAPGENAGGNAKGGAGFGSSLGINAFFRDVLHAPVANARWSWGGVDEHSRRVFLRVWRSEIQNRDGIEWVQVLSSEESSRPGRQERSRHLDLLRQGYSGFGVICERASPGQSAIAEFDSRQLRQLGRLAESNGAIWMEFLNPVDVSLFQSPGELPSDLKADLAVIESGEIAETTRTALIDARLGQGRFRRELLRRWNHACAVTGCRVAAMLRASHCKPWRDSNNAERLDSHNGLILTANLDALFDVGLISFDEGGMMVVANVISPDERKTLGIPARLLRRPGAKLGAYLRFHRENVFLGSKFQL
jgi:hypothetical protein